MTRAQKPKFERFTCVKEGGRGREREGERKREKKGRTMIYIIHNITKCNDYIQMTSQ